MNEPLLVSFLLSAVCHGTCLLGLVWLLVRWRWLQSLATQEAAWRCALIVPLLSAALQVSDVRTVARLEWTLASPRTGAALQAEPSRAQSVRIDVDVQRSADTVREGPAFMTSPVTTIAALPRSEHAAALDFTELGLQFIELICAAWLLSIGLSSARIAVLIARSRKHVRGLSDVADLRLLEVARRVAARMSLRLPSLKWDASLAGPATVAGGTVCLPEWSCERLNDQQLEALLAHEFAHVRRRDPAWQILWSWLVLVLPLPLGSLARRRLRELAELQCDACAAQQGRGVALAQSLLICAEHTQPVSARSTFAVAVLGSRSTFVLRVQRLLEKPTMKISLLGLRGKLGIALITLAAMALLPTVALRVQAATAVIADPAPADPVSPEFPREPVSAPEPAEQPEPPELPEPVATALPTPAPVARAVMAQAVRDSRPAHLHVSESTGTNTSSLSLSKRGYTFRAEVRGKVTINAAEDDVTSLEGNMVLEERRDGITRRIELTPRQGSIRREFLIDGEPRPIDSAARQWFTDALRRFIRESGFDAPARVQRLYKAGGAAGVFAEVRQIDSDYARGLYLRSLLTTPTLDDAAMGTLLSLTGVMASDFERRQVLAAAFQRSLSAASQTAALQITAQMSSDFEQRSVLTQAARSLVDQPAVLDAWFAALKGVDSDFERRTALQSIVARIRGRAGAEQLLDAAASIGSDFESRQALESIVPLIDTSELAVRYAKVTTNIASSFERRQALQALTARTRIDSDVALAILAAIDGITSDFETRMALADLAGRMPGSSTVIERYSAIANRLSQFERAEAERALDRFTL